MKKYAMLGAAGYIAPKHFKAIKETGGNLVAAHDIHDSVGLLDSYFPEAFYFSEFERFERFLEKQKRTETSIDFLTVCTPNYLHDAHIRFGLRYGANVICEKPTVLNPWNIDALLHTEVETNQKVFTILQLRYHQKIRAWKDSLATKKTNTKHHVKLTYITPRGNWYYASWKADAEKSGGVAMNIGVHFFDLLIWLFGSLQQLEIHTKSFDRVGGFIELENAYVSFFLSINAETLPSKDAQNGPYRTIEIDNEVIRLDDGFQDLHTTCYSEILHGNGWLLSDVLPSISCIHQVNNSAVQMNEEKAHPLSKLPLAKHPFEK